MERLNDRRRVSVCDGFSLLEMMLALMILGSGLLAVAAMQIQAMDYGRRGRHQTQAATIAQNQIESLQRRPWVALTPTAGWTASTTVNHVVNDGGSRTEQSYEVSWRIVNRVVGLTRAIDVRVNWDEVKRPGREYSISGIRYNQ